MEVINLRIRSPSGVSTIQINPNSSRQELYQIISSNTQLADSTFEIRLGFPRPQLLPDSSPTATIKSLGITNGETLQISLTNSAPLIQPPKASAPSIQQPSASASASTPNPSSKSKPENVSVPIDGLGHLILRLIADDNSCLFNAIGLCLERTQSNVSSKLRQIVAQAVRKDPLKWSEAVLGRSPELYISKILDKNVWGGAIEISILSGHYQTEICSIDVKTGRIDRFGESENYSNRIILIYSGIHYDALTLTPDLSTTDTSFDTTIFSTSQDDLLSSSLQLVKLLREQHYFTDTASFSLRCMVCKTALVGEADARKHAEQTGHTQFGEYA
ncbi:uncharacterized protein MELLADRAFT_74313 [Melampsora larici-populina 98AG31]|uniref:Ubiquitin thioesterase OTU n=1 Tax=Melampsora larici-populina (strain 98AG31 / pathotype 3-4-7) TaxID=747676 RepID=F4RCL2_MELLP|nr:uncharacterized protein MELLADRAFT_74313 [Melampsora larici-populina 98AG31]EGG09943.1 hypothetical protein MELLADRAFT_74313 [Melampsora larici-populina 98AG31]